MRGGKRSSPERLAKAVPKNVQTSKAVLKGRDTASEVFLFISLFCFQPQAPRSQITELRFRSVISVSFFSSKLSNASAPCFFRYSSSLGGGTIHNQIGISFI